MRAFEWQIFLAIGCMLILSACGGASGSDPKPDAVALSETAALASSCSGCHAATGAAIASLSGRSAGELESLLLEYRHGEGTTVMHRLARAYSDEQIAAVSAYVAEGIPQ